ncbi:MAG: hypothetical protein QG599_1751, partial [Pseudomonadota bacterium]|nr:hypothetical protein [Pseudomonadota bacterium]
MRKFLLLWLLVWLATPGTTGAVDAASNFPAPLQGALALIAALTTVVIAQAFHIQRRKITEQKYRDLVENANSIILKWGRDGRIKFLNDYGLQFFGYTEAEIVGQPLAGTIVPPFEEGGRDLTAMLDNIVQHPEQYA